MTYQARCFDMIGDEVRTLPTNRESPALIASGIRMAHYAKYYVRKSSILLAGTCVRKISSVACRSSPIKSFFLISQKV